MRLNEFILTRLNDILVSWERDAKTILPDRDFSKAELRDHIKLVLKQIVTRMDRPRDKLVHSKTEMGADSESVNETWAHIHGAQRFRLGADMVQVTAEFRALRVAVIQLWAEQEPASFCQVPEDLIRFSEAIDKALADSIERYVFDKDKQDRLYRAMLSSLPDPCCILGRDGRFLYVNEGMAELVGIAPDELEGQSVTEVVLPGSCSSPEQFNRVIELQEQYKGEMTTTTSSGKVRTLEYVLAPVIDDAGEVEAVSGLARDVTERRASESKVWRHANYDLLTSVPNRRLFRDRLKQHTAHSERTGAPLAILFIDLDHFKDINDQHGHDVGDMLLKQAAERIGACIRQSDTLARLGGDEFTIILLDTVEIEQLTLIATTILSELSAPFDLGSVVVRISGSIGITQYPQDATSAKQLLVNADKAMYFAKHAGRNQVCFFNDLSSMSLTSRQELVRDLREAPRLGQLRVHYQPIIELATGRLSKVEALLRWQHPDLGLLLPGEFLEIAEETGVIDDLEDWLLSEVAQHSTYWHQLSDSSPSVTINTSSKHFIGQTNQRWRDHLAQFNASGTDVVVELTERVFLNDANGLNDQFAKLREAGLQLAIDDYGSGDSSLANLKRYGIHYLKIDPSFVSSYMPDTDDQLIAETIVMMAHKLELRVIAEGVETAEQRDWLKAAGCDFAQGYFLGEPMTAEAIEAQLKQA
ncbi:sensor domain-containing protein [Marinobacter sp. 1Y8]